MPTRKGFKHHLGTEMARRLLKDFLRKEGITPTEVSRRVGVNQSTVQRFLSGRTKSISKSARKILEYANIDEKKCINSEVPVAAENLHIRQALERVWDGNESSARLLANIILAAAPLLAMNRTN